MNKRSYRVSCKHHWLLRDDGRYECDSCGLILTKQRLDAIQRDGIDIQSNVKFAVVNHVLMNPRVQLWDCQSEIDEFIDLLVEKRRVS